MLTFPPCCQLLSCLPMALTPPLPLKGHRHSCWHTEGFQMENHQPGTLWQHFLKFGGYFKNSSLPSPFLNPCCNPSQRSKRKIRIENAPTKPLQWTLPKDELLSWNGVREVNVLPVLPLLTEFKMSAQLCCKQWKKCTVESTAASHFHSLPRLQIIQNS